jgi:hypothetical protein
VLIITLKPPGPGATTLPFDKVKFRKELAIAIGYPEVLIGVSDPDKEGKVAVALLGSDQAQVDKAVQKAETLTPAQLDTLGATAIVDGKKPAEQDTSLAILVGAIAGGIIMLLLCVILIVFLRRRRNHNQRTNFVTMAISDERPAEEPMVPMPESKHQQSSFGPRHGELTAETMQLGAATNEAV